MLIFCDPSTETKFKKKKRISDVFILNSFVSLSSFFYETVDHTCLTPDNCRLARCYLPAHSLKAEVQIFIMGSFIKFM